MDKRESEKTITIKINGKKQEFEETRQQPKRNPEPLIAKKEEPIKFSVHHSDEISSHTEAAAARAQQDESFDWILPERSENPEIKEFHVPTISNAKKKPDLFGKRQGSFFKTIFTAVLLAIVVGTSFGFIMLKLVLTDNSAEKVNVADLGNETKQTENQSGNEEKNPPGSLSFVLPKISTFVIQGGAFSSQDSAEKELQTVKSKGSATRIIEIEGKSFLYLSVVDNKVHADELEASFKESGMVDVFDKVLEVGGKEVTGLQAGEREFLEAIPTLYQSLVIAGANASLHSVISQQVSDNIDQQAKKIVAIEDKQFTNNKIKTLKVTTDNALKQIDAIKDKATESESMALQQQLLAILAIYQSL